MKVDIKELVELLDGHEQKWCGHITSVIGIVGEDINAAIFVDFLKRKKRIKDKNIEVCSEPVTTGQQKGKRLDRWIRVGKYLYQTEIKNSCSFKIGGYELGLNADAGKVIGLSNKNWVRELNEQYIGKHSRTHNSRRNQKEFGGVSKVLSEMRIPTRLLKYKNKIRPLVIHWMPISDKDSVFFSVPVNSLGLSAHLLVKTRFKKKRVYYFSSSLYLRELLEGGVRLLNLDLPDVVIRMSALHSFLDI